MTYLFLSHVTCHVNGVDPPSRAPKVALSPACGGVEIPLNLLLLKGDFQFSPFFF